MQTVEDIFALICDYGHVNMAERLSSFFQMIANLTGQSTGRTHLTGEYMTEEKRFSKWTETNNSMALQKGYFCRTILAYIFCDFALAKATLSKLAHSPWAYGPEPFVVIHFFFESLVYFAAYKLRRKRKYLKRARRAITQFEKWLEKYVVNCHPLILILKAENMAVSSTSDPDEARKCYDKAIAVCGRLGILYGQAIANERAGDYFLDRGDREWAATYLARSKASYRAWGAHAKVEQIDQLHKDILENFASNDGGVDCLGYGIRARTRLEVLATPCHGLLGI